MKLRLWLLLIFVCCGCSLSRLSAPTQDATAATEEPFYAPDFSLLALDGSTYTLGDLQGKWVVVNFWATWCVPCVEEMPDLQTIADIYYGDVVVLGVNMRESEQQISRFITAQNINFPILLAPPDAVLIDYNVIGLPQTFIVTPAGEIVYRSFGPLVLEEFQQIIDDLIKSP